MVKYLPCSYFAVPFMTSRTGASHIPTLIL